MKKDEFVAKMAEKTGLSKKATEDVIKAFLETTKDVLVDGDSINFAGFGTFGVSSRAARKGKNPRTGEVINIPASKVPSFKAGKALKEAVNK